MIRPSESSDGPSGQPRPSASFVTFIVFSCFLQSAGETGFGQALHTEAVHGIDTAGMRLSLWNALNGSAHAGDVENVEIGAAEHDARQVAEREGNHAIDASIRRIANDAAAEDMRIPDIALRVHCRAVEGARIVQGIGEDSPVAYFAALDVIVISVHDV